MDDKYLLEQNKDPAKVTFEKEVKLIEFTETINDMDSNLNYDQKKRDIFLFKHGKKLFKRFKLRKTKKRNIYFKLEPRILTQAEIDELLTAVEIYPFPKVIISMIILTFKGIITKIQYGYKHICQWKLVIRKNNVVYKIGLDEIKKIDYNIPQKPFKASPVLTQDEFDEIRRGVSEVLSEEEMDMLLTPIEKEEGGKK
jgi:hypothetical protein